MSYKRLGEDRYYKRHNKLHLVKHTTLISVEIWICHNNGERMHITCSRIESLHDKFISKHE